MPTQPVPRLVPPRPTPRARRSPLSARSAAMKTTGKMPRCELDLLRREAASGETFEDGVPPSSLALPLVTRKSREARHE
jgi:hypothetical protein